MSVSIVNCPKCNSLVLPDTAECPSCHHVLAPHRAVGISQAKTHSEVIGANSNEIPCPDCGEMVRKELVRCWRCGGFLRSDIAEKYQKMRENSASNAASVSVSDIPSVASLPTASDDLPPLADDDDFSLGPGVMAIAPSQVSPASPPPMIEDDGDSDDDDSYSLNTPVVSAESATSESASLPDVPLDDSDKSSGNKPGRASESDVPHSEATAGDALLDIAKQEEQESESRRKQRGKRRPGTSGRAGFIIFCPYGHQIEVQERHRGQMGKCPRCKSAFIVPAAEMPEKNTEAEAASATETAPAVEPPGTLAAGKFTRWMNDVHVHPLDPTKLKLKPGSLESAFDLLDFAFGLDGLLLLGLVKKGSLFSSADKKKPEVREAVVAHLAAGKPLSDLQVASQRLFAPDSIKQIQVVQPAAYAHESMFAGIPVFGNHRIAVRLPKPADSNDLLFASFWLSEFREFVKQMQEVFEITGLGEDVGVPLTDKFSQHKCHYTDQTFQALENTDYHQADPNIKLAIVGRKCEGCGLVISEDGRKKEKLGGADGKGIAKAKCPKCQKKFGSITFYAIDQSVPDASAAAS